MPWADSGWTAYQSTSNTIGSTSTGYRHSWQGRVRYRGSRRFEWRGKELPGRYPLSRSVPRCGCRTKSNGHAEAAIKSLKHLISKVAPTGNVRCGDFDRGLIELRNTPNPTGRSPARILFCHSLRTCVPAHPCSFQAEWQPDAEKCEQRAAKRDEEVRARYKSRTRELPAVSINQRVRIQDPATKRW